MPTLLSSFRQHELFLYEDFYSSELRCSGVSFAVSKFAMCLWSNTGYANMKSQCDNVFGMLRNKPFCKYQEFGNLLICLIILCNLISPMSHFPVK